MNRWQSFLTSLATPGGNILILCLFSIVMLIAVLLSCYGTMSKDQQIVTFLLTTAASFFGALVGILRGRTSDPSGSTGTTTTTSATSTIASPPSPGA